MATWLKEYVVALESRDAAEKAQEEFYNAYARLSDHTASICRQQENVPAETGTPISPITATPKTKPRMTSFVTGQLPFRSPTPPDQPSSASPLSSTSDMQRLRGDLAAAQRSKTALSTELASVKSSLDEKRAALARAEHSVSTLTRERAVLARKLRDRDEELREKARLVERVQDEMLGLEMQVNVAEEGKGNLQKDYDELVERWMVEKGKKADEMNKQGGWSID